MTDIHRLQTRTNGMSGRDWGFGVAGAVETRRRVFVAEGDL